MSHWNPAQYLQFGGERLRPALDLMTQIALDQPGHIVDLGCGPGNVTALLQHRWPEANICGIDSSPDMLAQARKNNTHIDWQQADIAHWQPERPVDLIFSNACLHWLNDHENLFQRLLSLLTPGGVLAVQMPNNFAAPTHRLIAEVLGENHPLAPGFPVHSPAAYYGWLVTQAQSLNLWETTYLHVLDGDNPVADWTRGAALRPVLDGLDTKEKEEFETAYRAKIADAYPKVANAKTLLPFKRFFLIAQK